jgi:hypothetical protein
VRRLPHLLWSPAQPQAVDSHSTQKMMLSVSDVSVKCAEKSLSLPFFLAVSSPIAFRCPHPLIIFFFTAQLYDTNRSGKLMFAHRCLSQGCVWLVLWAHQPGARNTKSISMLIGLFSGPCNNPQKHAATDTDIWILKSLPSIADAREHQSPALA